jgi:hypothetical protein
MKWIGPSLGVAVALVGHDAGAKSRLTDPLKIARACKSEAQTICKGVRAGRQRIIKCLNARAAELSLASSTALKSAE